MSSRGSQNEAKIAPWRPPGGPWRLPGGSLEALWRLWGAEDDFRPILDAVWEALGTPKLLKIDAKIEPEIEQRFGASF